MQLQLAGLKKKIELKDEVFSCDFNEALIHQVVTAYLAGGRAGTKAQKNRAAVRGGGIKPWNQKGSGRARAGTIRSPIWRKGGVTFAAQPRDFSQKVNKKMVKGAMRSILSELIRQERLVTVETFTVDEPKTKHFLTKLKELNLPEKNVLVITSEVEKNLYLASRNIPNVVVCDVAAMNPVSLISAEKILVTSLALKQIEELLG